jgi:hypothetical protein
VTEIIHTEAEAKAELHRLRESPFWQRQRELIQGRIEPATPIPVRTFSRTWHWVALCVCVVCLIAIVRGVN